MSDGIIDWNRTWWGYGVKYGGFLVAAGLETTEGFIYNAKSMSWNEKFTLTSWRIGAGLGGGAGAVAIMIFNAGSLSAIDGTEVSGPGVNISFGPNTKPMFEAITKAKLTPSDLEKISQGLNYFFTAYDIATTDGPQIVAIDIGGIAWEVSATYATGKFAIDWGVAE